MNILRQGQIDNENEEKLKNVAKTINSLNKDDQKIILDKLNKNAADNDNITYMERERIDRAAETLNNLDNEDQKKVINKLRGRMKKPKQKAKLNKLESTLKNLNKIKELAKKLKKKPIIDDDNKNIKTEEEVEKLPEKELNELAEGFIGDLYNTHPEDEHPKTRAEKREIDNENEEKLKNIAKTINI